MQKTKFYNIQEYATKSTFFIKDYQRAFVWKKKDINLFVDSLNKGIYYGVATAKVTKEKNNKYHFEIIDGQQRIISYALLFGHLQNIEFDFNVDSKTVNNKLNNIISSGDLENLEKLKGTLKGNHYLEKIFNFKKDLLSSDLKLNELFKKSSAPTIAEISNKSSIVETFSRLNTSGSSLILPDFYKAATIEKNSKIFDNESWSKALEKFIGIETNSLYSPGLDDLFAQVYNSFYKNKTKDSSNVIWISKSKSNFKPNQLINIFHSFEEYLTWAYDVLPKKNEIIKTPDTFCIFSITGKVLGIFGSVVFAINNNNLGIKIRDMKRVKEEIKFSLSVLMNLYSMAQENFPTKIMKDDCKEIINSINSGSASDDVFKKVQKILNEKILVLIQKWGGKFKKDVFRNAKFWFGEKDVDKFEYPYKINTECSHFVINVKSVIFELWNLKNYNQFEKDEPSLKFVENDDEEDDKISTTDLEEILKKYNPTKVKQKYKTVEHIFNGGNNEILFLELVTKKAQGDKNLCDKTIDLKIKYLEKNPNEIAGQESKVAFWKSFPLEAGVKNPYNNKEIMKRRLNG